MKGKNSPKFSVNRVLRRIFGHKSDEITRSGEHCIMRRFMICTAHKTLFGLKLNDMDRACGMYVGQKRCIQSFGGGT